MEDPDPYFCVQDEVVKNLQAAKKLYEEWISAIPSLESPENTTQLRQILKSIEWDLMDLQQTVSAVEKNPSRFHLSEEDIKERRQFLVDARNIVRRVKNNLNSTDPQKVKKESIDFNVHTASSTEPTSTLANGGLSSRKKSEKEISITANGHVKNSNLFKISTDPLEEQKQLLRDQDDRLDQLGTSISSLKGISRRLGDELGDQVALLDDFSGEMAHTESRLNSITKRTARLLHLSTDRRQWCAIFSLSITLFIILILLALL